MLSPLHRSHVERDVVIGIRDRIQHPLHILLWEVVRPILLQQLCPCLGLRGHLLINLAIDARGMKGGSFLTGLLGGNRQC